MWQKWGMEGSWHLNVRSTQRGRVEVSSCPCVYCCLHIDLFPDTWAMTWKEFRLQQILHCTSMWPLGLSKGKSITVAMVTLAKPWWRVLMPLALSRVVAQADQSGMVTPQGCSACAPTLPAPHQAAPWTGLCHVDGASEDTKIPIWDLSKLALTLFWGESGSCSKGERGVLCLAQVMQILVSGSWRWACKDSLRLLKRAIIVMDLNH